MYNNVNFGKIIQAAWVGAAAACDVDVCCPALLPLFCLPRWPPFRCWPPLAFRLLPRLPPLAPLLRFPPLLPFWFFPACCCTSWVKLSIFCSTWDRPAAPPLLPLRTPLDEDAPNKLADDEKRAMAASATRRVEVNLMGDRRDEDEEDGEEIMVDGWRGRW
ncbi:hypothetical protein BCR44DRAFT_1439664 [Catenaria anguillulae PL171]|uniref:Uncharacterized protein n=1 Tax=Catenaria anguillulae PL171 TaxID=765915 RepID=A0A1Y2HFK1_9FUNG|nr:hypothetical protein BCR44DRAFT_1439664 [Catenaria anguillulae PL171]